MAKLRQPNAALVGSSLAVFACCVFRSFASNEGAGNNSADSRILLFEGMIRI
jgi:hypothetical protein